MNSADPLLDAWRSLVSRREQDPLVLGPDRCATVGDIQRLAETAQLRLEEASLVGLPVALSSPNGPAFLALVLALRKLSCPILLVDWTTKREERQRIQQALGARAFVVVTEAWPRSRDWFETSLESSIPAAIELPAGTEFIKLTSGSTGEPRGVAVSTEALLADDRGLASSMGIRVSDRILAAIPLTHSYGFSSIALPALLRGTTIVVPGSGPLAAMKATREHHVTFLPTVPAYIESLVKTSRPPAAPASLRLVITAGAPITPDAARSFREIYGQPIHVFYGASECGGICYDREGAAAERGALGSPVEGVSVSLEPTTSSFDGNSGRVVVRSEAVALSYVPTPEPSLGSGCFQTSDLGTFETSGDLRLAGRVDALINIKGKKIHPGEIEATLRDLPGVAEAVVMAVNDPRAGDLLRAVIVRSDSTEGRQLEEASVRSFCRDQLADFKVPRSIVILHELPVTARGKLDRRLLSQSALTPKPEPETRAEG